MARVWAFADDATRKPAVRQVRRIRVELIWFSPCGYVGVPGKRTTVTRLGASHGVLGRDSKQKVLSTWPELIFVSRRRSVSTSGETIDPVTCLCQVLIGKTRMVWVCWGDGGVLQGMTVKGMAIYSVWCGFCTDIYGRECGAANG